uniref:CHAT domain-containing protein n=1 Tax=Gloeothece verrucosa (strain PCC 7822) TaxID=497965 RepID=E0UM76_GLOV7|nr:conserved hypothetical protein [Gloeothece verrucosa PCC 7822]
MPRVRKILKFVIIVIISVVVITVSPFLDRSVISAPPTNVESKCGEFQESCHLLLERIQQWIEQGNLTAARARLTEIEPFLPVEFKAVAQAISANIALRSGHYQQAISLLSPLTQLNNFTGNNRAALLYNLAQAYLEKAYVYQQQGQTTNSFQNKNLNNEITSNRLEAVRLLREIMSSASLKSAMAIKAALVLGELGEAIDIQSLYAAIGEYPEGLEKIEFLLKGAKLKGVDSRSLYLEAIEIAQKSKQPLGKSWAWGYWGEYLLEHKDYRGAIKASIEAQLPIGENPDWHLRGRWLSLAAKAFEELGDKNNALKVYEEAFFSIKQLRKDLAGAPISPELIDLIQGILRNYLELLLEDPLASQAQLKKATEILNLTALTEVERYFRSVCNVAPEAQAAQNKLTSREALIYTAILNNQVSIILELPDQTYHLTSHPIQKEELNKLIITWRKQLADRFGDDLPNTKNNGNILFNLIVADLLPILKAKQIEHLIFINDGLLRNVSMAALFDGNKYLIEGFQISYSSGLKSFKSHQIDFPSSLMIVNAEADLRGVEAETEQIATVTEGHKLTVNSLIDLKNNLQKNSYNLLHLATESQFSGLIENTSINIGEQTIAWTDFENFLRSLSSSLDYLTLSSCETAQGNQYAVLGLAGLGLRTGVSSVVGSLWKIHDDATTDFMSDFYFLWKTTNNIDQALQLAQIQRIKRSDQINRPAYWSSFIILR